ncbi:phosphate ABC transporter permease subunit PstC [Pseudovibrio sp. Tun.PSC04-5.I4]|uniref:phosphate ABC transporter permease subunit PstC n=1 Tax=Pseudovibrio sp. Tun.PSC04-5.I4 TaxID=1798213 RepID=UPI00087F56A0|nr:phosphate ABC transporter permease subunit PstC [Pseudovibrio sp. Tun.PSC04-5.I4]SDQ83020.1 phosphate ABC transporter membrane protein 1, PhoT family [Pseudovibrio sp. Tun.PSC04-5.I4]
MFWTYAALLLLVFVASNFYGRLRAAQVAGNQLSVLHSRPSYHGGYLAILSTLPALAVLLVWAIIEPRLLDTMVINASADVVEQLSKPELQAYLRDARAIAFGGIVGFTDAGKEQAAEVFKSLAATSLFLKTALIIVLISAGLWYGTKSIRPTMRARHFVERTIMGLLILCSAVAIFTTIGIVLSLIFESLMFFRQIPILDFVFGMHWSPQSAFEGAGSETAEVNTEIFGAIPLLMGTMLITAIAISVAAPVGLLSAIYLSDYASGPVRAVAKPMLEILAGIPTVVYGFFAALTVAPFIRGWGESIGLSVSSESALAAGLVMGIMIIPFVSSLSDDVINAVPQSLRDGSAGLGATKSETIRRVVLPAALPGIVSALILAISRAIGETMIVVMAAGLAANMTVNPLQAVTTVTVQIVTLLVGDQEFDSAKTLAAFALGLLLFCITLALNIFALRVVKKYREQYD